MGLDAPHGKFPDIQFHILEGEQQVSHAIVLERGHVLSLERAAVQQNVGLG